jgi:hypothetical protein
MGEHIDNKSNIFRIAMILYSETDGIKNKKVIIKKVVEATFLEMDNILLSIREIVSNINELYKMSILEDEVIEILESSKNKNHFNKEVENKNIKYQLEDKRFEKLKERGSKNIGEFIEEYVTNNELDETIKEAIYKYLYIVFQTGIEELESVLTGKCVVLDDVNYEFSQEEAKHINMFLQWDNNDKNIALMALLGYSLEYSMLTCNVESLYGNRLGEAFSNKKLYIDTNIIYYCLGVNGEEYKEANEALLNLCKDCKEKLYISSVTETEFKNTLKHYINEIKKHESPTVNSIRYNKYMDNNDIYLFYLNWKKSRKKFNEPNYFEKYILTEYAKWLRKYDVKIDNKMPFDASEPKIEQYSQEIQYKGTINYDALNILWIEKKRKKKGQTGFSFSDAQYFLLSPHRALQRWDMKRRDEIQVVVSPKTWMLLLRKFTSRSRNDYLSFINFINIKVPSENVINNKTFYMIVQAVGEVTSDIQQQESIIDVLVEEKFAYLTKNDDSEELSAEEIQDKTRDKATEILQKEVKELRKEVDILKDSKTRLTEGNEQNYLELQTAKDEIKRREEENQKLTNNNEKLIQQNIKFRLKIKRVIHSFIVAGIALFVLWQILDIFIWKNENNIYISFVKYCMEVYV